MATHWPRLLQPRSHGPNCQPLARSALGKSAALPAAEGSLPQRAPAMLSNRRNSWPTVRAVKNRSAVDDDPAYRLNAHTAGWHGPPFEQLHAAGSPCIGTVYSAILKTNTEPAAEIMEHAKIAAAIIEPAVKRLGRSITIFETDQGQWFPWGGRHKPEADRVQPFIAATSAPQDRASIATPDLRRFAHMALRAASGDVRQVSRNAGIVGTLCG